MNILVLQIFTEEIKEYTFYSTQINSAYCVDKGYTYKILKTFNEEKHSSWKKLDFIREELESNISYDWIFLLDADAVFRNFDINLEDIVKNIKDKNIIVCDDIPNGGLINCGAFFVKNDEESLIILNEWDRYGKEEGYNTFQYWEQDALRHILEAKTEIGSEFVHKIKILPNKTFNSYWQTIPEDNFIAHFMGRPLHDKISLIKKEYQNFVRKTLLKKK